MPVKIAILALYAAMVITVGIIGRRGTRSFADFFLAGGKVGPWMTAFSYGTAYFSAVVFIGFAGKVGWGFGLSGIWIGFFNAALGVLGVWALMGWKIKQMATTYNVSTMSEFFEKRYGSPFLKLFASVNVFVFLLPYSAAVFIGLSYLFQASFPGLEYWHAVVFMGFFTAFYMVLGGYRSMTIIDTIFGMIMTLGVLLLLGFTLSRGGGAGHILEGLRAIDPGLAAPVGPPGWWPLLSLVVLTSVAPFAMPQLVQKFYAIRDRNAIRRGTIASTIFALLIGGVAYFVGATTRVFLNPNVTPAAFPAGEISRPNVDALMPELLNLIIPESLTIVILVLILAASMSTLAALVLISSSSLVKDVYAGFINRAADDLRLTSLMRLASGFFILLSVIIALIKPSTIVAILGISWGAIGAAFLGPFVWGLFSRHIGKFEAISASVLALALTLFLYAGGMPSPQSATIGMGASLVIPPLFSLLRRPFRRS